ncbi:UNVERIFIED_CONTAM: hypothetical protein Sindi_0875400 [Sesamum indicum]
MGWVKAFNSTDRLLIFGDHYVLTATPKSGYDGTLRYSIAAGDIQKIPTDYFLEKAARKRKPQEIHVRDGGETLLVWEHEEFISNEGKEVILKMGGDGVLRSSFVAPGGISALRTEKKSMAQWIRNIFSFPSAGANVESPVAELDGDENSTWVYKGLSLDQVMCIVHGKHPVQSTPSPEEVVILSILKLYAA